MLHRRDEDFCYPGNFSIMGHKLRAYRGDGFRLRLLGMTGVVDLGFVEQSDRYAWGPPGQRPKKNEGNLNYSREREVWEHGGLRGILQKEGNIFVGSESAAPPHLSLEGGDSIGPR
jgi:hypothetical protein